MTVNTITSKKCIKCGGIHPITKFGKDNSFSDGLDDHCDFCNLIIACQSEIEELQKEKRKAYINARQTQLKQKLLMSFCPVQK
ncbi:MAG: hypothetical protein A2287_09430 [Candidatus Melainabacteria bacterium RIFOXYA12_FULL_32_12]|nr:MAG: hypothetical protein A2287_09430 [Candidatus Melainabacteria bacterium RIFOXYA12_FULL_32_12]